MQERKLLIIDDEPDFANLVTEIANELSFEVESVTSFDVFRSQFKQMHPTHVFIDLMMPDIDGIEVLRYLANNKCRSNVVIMSGLDTKILSTAQRVGEEHGLNMMGVLQKPFHISDLEKLLETEVAGPEFGYEEIKQALMRDEFIVYFQPKISLGSDGTRSIVGAEALVRWQHPTRGIIYPNDFIPVAETTGLITLLTDVVIKKSLKQSQIWRERGVDLIISINVAPRSLVDLRFPDRLYHLIEAASVPANRIVLEVTESSAMQNDLVTADILTRFRLKGVGLSLDDFGTGFSSLTELYRMPFTELKIDRSFVCDLEKSEEAKVIVKSIIDLAHNLSLSICAEGAETEYDLNFLILHGADMVQGYAISKALPPEEFLTFYRAWQNKYSDSTRISK